MATASLALPSTRSASPSSVRAPCCCRRRAISGVLPRSLAKRPSTPAVPRRLPLRRQPKATAGVARRRSSPSRPSPPLLLLWALAPRPLCRRTPPCLTGPQALTPSPGCSRPRPGLLPGAPLARGSSARAPLLRPRTPSTPRRCPCWLRRQPQRSSPHGIMRPSSLRSTTSPCKATTPAPSRLTCPPTTGTSTPERRRTWPTTPDLRTREVILRCNSDDELYPLVVGRSSTRQSLHVSITPALWHQRLGHPGFESMSKILASFQFSCNKSKSTTCHACRLGKHVCLPFT